MTNVCPMRLTGDHSAQFNMRDFPRIVSCLHARFFYLGFRKGVRSESYFDEMVVVSAN